ncbi:RNAse P Rpr2/Rpp21/SNM1 subunit domain-containing protein [Purpureocillium lavendulum]|uniref:RNAse P Rpr2/Rpp21/SNM1 subunit domain-containing protein n=1 Tax=Purpureocillium lavendulum TaxID=1247861 RepID=A0AB34FAK5_9HYPO|nr:RNAse P Rpr2/Rpp21/SNM1 subunit domain-containing protein [Purpureocillium lavendulum]
MPAAAFNVPSQYRRFTLFPHLPPEIRHRVWEEYLRNRGVSFVKVELPESAWRAHYLPPLLTGTDDERNHQQLHLDEVSLAIKRETVNIPTTRARLVATYPVHLGDISNYRELHAGLSAMSRVCRESSSLVRQLTSREGTLRLETGTVVALDSSQDLITLDYLPPDLHQTDCALEIDIACPGGLDKVRRAAVRVSPMWKAARTFPAKCRTCRELHEVRDGGNCPTHVYQFLARHLPNLEEFYLMDYFVVEKSDSEKATWDILHGNRRDGGKCSANAT